MKSILAFAAVALTASVVTFGASAQGLLGGLITSGSSGSGLISLDTSGGNTSIGLLGSDGLSVNLPTGGTGGSSSLGLEGVLEVSGAPTSGGGSGIGISLLGGEPQGNSLNPLGLLGGGGGIGLGLPNLGGVIGGGGGGNGGNGGNGSNPTINIYTSTLGGGNGANGGNGGSGGSVTIPSNISSRMQMLLRILAARNYLRVANGKAVCLSSFSIAEVANWVPQKDWGMLQQALGSYSQDIYTLRQLLANCRNAGQRQALNLTDLNRVIAIDIKNGQPVLYML